MVNLRLEVQGADRLSRKLRPDNLLGPALRELHTQITSRLRRAIVENTPVDTGRLRSSITSKIAGEAVPLWSMVGTSVKYAPFVETGTRPHWTSVANLQNWADKHGINAYALQRAIASRGTEGAKMFDKGRQEIEQEIPKLVTQANRKIEEAFRN